MASSPKRDPRHYGTTAIRVKDLKTCHYCKSSPLPETSVFCPSCGFPQRGTELDQKRFMIGRNKMGKNVNETEASIGIARIVLYGLGILNGGLAIWFFKMDQHPGGFTQAVIAAVYIGLGLWAAKKPFPALLTGLVVYGTFMFVSAIINPGTIFSGIFLKFLIFSSLIFGMRAVKKAENMRKQMEVQKMDLSGNPENPITPL